MIFCNFQEIQHVEFLVSPLANKRQFQKFNEAKRHINPKRLHSRFSCWFFKDLISDFQLDFKLFETDKRLSNRSMKLTMTRDSDFLQTCNFL